MKQLKALEMLKKAYFSPCEFTKEDYNEAIAELEGLQAPKTCETCSEWEEEHSGSIFGVCAIGNSSHFSDKETTYDYGCIDYELKDAL